MRSTFYGFEIAKSGLFASQQNLNITGHNISNVNTVGFTRQRLNVESIPAPFYMGTIAYTDKSASGQGVRMMYVDQIRDPFLDKQFRQENTMSKYWEAQEYEFSMIESLFNFEISDENTGISNVFAEFYSALHKLAENPSDPEVRQAVLGSARNLVSTMNQNAEQINAQYNDINGEIKATVTQINAITRSIAELNNQIFSYEMSGAQANDLRDRRNLLLDELAGYIPIHYEETPDKYLIVRFGDKNGEQLVNHAKSNDLALVENKDHAFMGPDQNGNIPQVYQLYWAKDVDPATGDLLNPATPAIDITEGALGAYFKMRDGDSEDNIGLPYVMTLLDELCQKVTTEFNEVHEQGWGLPSGGNPSTTGNKFFKDDVPVTAFNFALDPDITSDRIAASSVEVVNGADNEQRNNNVNALAIVELLNKTNSSGNPDNFDSVYKDILVAVGLEMSHINRMNTNQAVVLANIDNNRKSVSGVSIDEEITNIIKFGHSYNAASRVITAIDEQLETVITKMGIVGR